MLASPDRTDLDAAAADGRRPLRTCLVSGARRPKAEMLRFVIGPEDEVVPDLNQRLPGRGLWLSASRDMVNTACAKGAFAKAARRRVAVPDGLAERIDRLIVRRCVEAIGLARRAGQAVAGFEKARAELRAGKAGLVLLAADGADGGRDKILALSAGAPVSEILDSASLGEALARERTVYVVVAPGRFAERLQDDLARLARYRLARVDE